MAETRGNLPIDSPHPSSVPPRPPSSSMHRNSYPASSAGSHSQGQLNQNASLLSHDRNRAYKMSTNRLIGPSPSGKYYTATVQQSREPTGGVNGASGSGQMMNRPSTAPTQPYRQPQQRPPPAMQLQPGEAQKRNGAFSNAHLPPKKICKKKLAQARRASGVPYYVPLKPDGGGGGGAGSPSTSRQASPSAPMNSRAGGPPPPPSNNAASNNVPSQRSQSFQYQRRVNQRAEGAPLTVQPPPQTLTMRPSSSSSLLQGTPKFNYQQQSQQLAQQQQLQARVQQSHRPSPTSINGTPVNQRPPPQARPVYQTNSPFAGSPANIQQKSNRQISSTGLPVPIYRHPVSQGSANGQQQQVGQRAFPGFQQPQPQIRQSSSFQGGTPVRRPYGMNLANPAVIGNRILGARPSTSPATMAMQRMAPGKSVVPQQQQQQQVQQQVAVPSPNAAKASTEAPQSRQPPVFHPVSQQATQARPISQLVQLPSASGGRVMMPLATGASPAGQTHQNMIQMQTSSGMSALVPSNNVYVLPNGQNAITAGSKIFILQSNPTVAAQLQQHQQQQQQQKQGHLVRTQPMATVTTPTLANTGLGSPVRGNVQPAQTILSPRLAGERPMMPPRTIPPSKRKPIECIELSSSDEEDGPEIEAIDFAQFLATEEAQVNVGAGPSNVNQEEEVSLVEGVEEDALATEEGEFSFTTRLDPNRPMKLSIIKKRNGSSNASPSSQTEEHSTAQEENSATLASTRGDESTEQVEDRASNSMKSPIQLIQRKRDHSGANIVFMEGSPIDDQMQQHWSSQEEDISPSLRRSKRPFLTGSNSRSEMFIDPDEAIAIDEDAQLGRAIAASLKGPAVAGSATGTNEQNAGNSSSSVVEATGNSEETVEANQSMVLQDTSMSATESLYDCEVEGCGRSFVDENTLFEHKGKVHQLRPYTCPFITCTETFTNRFTINKHVSRTHGHITAWECRYCDGLFTTPRGLYDHCKYDHLIMASGPKLNPNAPIRATRMEVAASVEEPVASTSSAVAEESRPVVQLRKASMAVETQSTPTTVDQRKSTVTPKSTPAPRTPKTAHRYYCRAPDCGAHFVSGMKLGGHIQKMHRLLREWPCTGCGIVLRKHSELSEHVKICQTPAIFPPAAAAVAAQEEEEALEDAAGSSQESVHETAATVEAIKATSTEKTVEGHSSSTFPQQGDSEVYTPGRPSRRSTVAVSATSTPIANNSTPASTSKSTSSGRKCELCAYMAPLSSRNHLYQHYVDVHGQYRVHCPIMGCFMYFATPSAYGIHVNQKHKTKILSCYLCPGRRFITTGKLTEHYTLDHGKKPTEFFPDFLRSKGIEIEVNTPAAPSKSQTIETLTSSVAFEIQPVASVPESVIETVPEPVIEPVIESVLERVIESVPEEPLIETVSEPSDTSALDAPVEAQTPAQGSTIAEPDSSVSPPLEEQVEIKSEPEDFFERPIATTSQMKVRNSEKNIIQSPYHCCIKGCFTFFHSKKAFVGHVSRCHWSNPDLSCYLCNVDPGQLTPSSLIDHYVNEHGKEYNELFRSFLESQGVTVPDKESTSTANLNSDGPSTLKGESITYSCCIKGCFRTFDTFQKYGPHIRDCHSGKDIDLSCYLCNFKLHPGTPARFLVEHYVNIHRKARTETFEEFLRRMNFTIPEPETPAEPDSTS